MQMAADMGAGGRRPMELPSVVAERRDLAQPFANDGALARFQFVDGFQFAGRNVFGKILHRRDVLGDEILGCGKRDAGGIVEFGPRACLAGDQARQQEASRDAMGEALPGIAGMHEDVLVAGIAADKGRVVDGSSVCPDQRCVTLPSFGNRP